MIPPLEEDVMKIDILAFQEQYYTKKKTSSYNRGMSPFHLARKEGEIPKVCQRETKDRDMKSPVSVK